MQEPLKRPAGVGHVDRLINEMAPRLYRYALVRLGRSDLAEEAVGETLCRLVDRGPTLGADLNAAHVRGWSVRCVVNVCRELERRPAAASRHDLEGQPHRARGMEFAQWYDDSDHQRALLMRALHRLPPRQREAVTLRVLMDLPVTAAAAAMNCAEGTVKALTHQGVAALRDYLSKDSFKTDDGTA